MQGVGGMERDPDPWMGGAGGWERQFRLSGPGEPVWAGAVSFPAAELPARGERPSRAVRPDLGGTAYFEERGLDQGSTAPTPRTVTVGSQSRCPL